MALDNYQPSLAITQLIQTTGPFPGNAVNEGDFIVAMVRMFAGNYAWEGTALAHGQLLALSQNTPLFSLLGTNFGGDGAYTFALPDLQGAASIGAGQGIGLTAYYVGEEPGPAEVDLTTSQVPAQWGGGNQLFYNVQPSLAINYLIRVSGDEDGVGADGTGDLLGGIVRYAVDVEVRGAPPGYLIADGQLLDKDVYPDLFALIGYTYGGDNTQFFALPDLRGRIPVGGTELQVGQTFGAEATTITQSQMPTAMGGGGQPVDNTAPSLVLRYIICIDGPFAPPGGTPDGTSADAYLGEISLYAGLGAIPDGWALCDGATIPISGNIPLFSILGTSYGGNGSTNFKLPDFTGKTDIGWGTTALENFNLGEDYGTDELTLTLADMPDLNFTGTGGDDTLLAGGDGNDTINGLAGNDTIVGNGGDDSLIGGDGQDSIEGGDGDDTIDGGAGNDTITGGAGVDFLIGGLGADRFLISSPDGLDDTIDGTNESGTQDRIDIQGAGTYHFTGANISNIDFISFEGHETTWTFVLTDELASSAHFDSAGRLRVEAVNTVQSVTIDASALGAGNAVYVRGNLFMDGADSITGGAGADSIASGIGDDTVDGGGGDDTIDGSVGSDSLLGGDGNDTFYVYDANIDAGSNTIDGGDGTDVISFRTAGTYSFVGATITDVEALLITGNGPWSITLTDEMVSNGSLTVSSEATASTLTLDGSLIGASNRLVVDGTNLSGSDSIIGGDGGDSLSGGAGDDTIIGNDGDDTITGGAGVDSLSGGGGDDTLVAGSATDFMDDAIDGGDGDDTLQLGAGSYSFSGLVWNIETIELTQAANLTITDATYNGLSGVLRIVSDGDIGGSISIDGSGLTVGHSLFVDASGMNSSTAMTGGGGDDTFMAGLGSDLIDGGNGFDTIDYSLTDLDLTASATAVISSGFSHSLASIEAFILGRGDDTFVGVASNETIYGLRGTDSIDGGAGDDTIHGGTGIDTLVGGLGGDTFFLFSAADLRDTIDGTQEQGTEDILYLDLAGEYDFTAPGISISYIDVIRLGGAIGDYTLILSDAIVATAAESGFFQSLGIEAVGVTGTITIDASALTDGHAIVINPSAINTDTDVTAGAGSDTIRLGSGRDTVHGGDGIDYISGGAGADYLDGGSGGDSIYIHNAAELTDGTDYDTIIGGAGNDTLFLLAPGTYDLRDTSISGIEYIQLGVGSTLLLGDMPGAANGYVTVYGFSNTPVTIDASAAIDTDFVFDGAGFEGNDTIIGGGGDDTFVSAAGADSFVGGDGADTFIANSAADFANDAIDGGDDGSTWDEDYLVLGAGLYDFRSPVSRIDTVYLNGSGATELHLYDDGVATSNFGGVGTIAIGSQVARSHTTLVNGAGLTGTHALMVDGHDWAANDSVWGGNGNDKIVAGLGQNHLTGGQGIDTVEYSLVSFDLEIVVGNGTVRDASGSPGFGDSINGFEIYVLGDGDDLFLGGAVSETITGGEGNDTIDGGGSADRVVYAGDWKDHTFSESGGEITVIANVTAEGTDTVSNVEYFEFAGGVVATASEILNDAPVAYTTTAGVTEPMGTPGVVSTTGVVITTDADTVLGDVTVVTSIRAGVESAGGTTTAVSGQTTVSGTYGTLTIEEDGTYTYTLNGGAMSAVRGGETVQDFFTYAIEDLHGGADSAQIVVTIYETNDAASGTDKTISIVEDGAPFTFGVADFGWFDSDGNDLQSIIITSLPAAGTLTYYGTPIAVDTALDIYGISIGALVFTPAPNGNGSPYGSFSFKVADNGGTDSGGQNTDPIANTIQFNVAGVNDAPVITSNGGAALTVSVNENAVAVTRVIASDIDSSVSYSLTGADAARFVVSSTGVVSFRTAPDFDAPSDAGRDNRYNVTVVASDGSLSDTQALTVTVGNIKGNTATGTSAANTISLTKKAPEGKVATNEEDVIDGKGGNDNLSGAGGNDTIIGGNGKDTLDGGAGADKFVFNAKLGGSNVDTIKSFAHDSDVIQLSDNIFSKIGPSLSAGEFYAKRGATSAHDRDDRIIYDTKTGKLYYDADGNKSGAAIHFATLTNKPALDHGDFGIV